MIDWLFIWSSKRPPLWEATTQNLNVEMSGRNFATAHGKKYYIPVNVSDMPEHIKHEFKHLKGQILDQFENEAFKFVVDANVSDYNPEDDIIIKPHMFLELGLNETNCKTFKLDTVYKHFKNYKWVALGLFFSGEHMDYKGRANSLAKSIFYGRNAQNKIINLETGLELAEYQYLSVVTYLVFKQLHDTNIITVSMNPNLVAMPHQSLDVIKNKHRFVGLDMYDTGIYEHLLKPDVSGGVQIGDTIFAKGNSVSVNLYENGLRYIKHSQLPDFEVELDTNLKYKVENNRYIFEADRAIGYADFTINVGSILDKYLEVSKAGKTKLQYIIVGEK